jgi:predicted ribosome quality control (RQC) complex YloA/Tae2 family protein
MKIKKNTSKLTNANNLLDKQKKILLKSNSNSNSNQNNKEQLNTNTNKYIIIGQSKPNWFEQFNWFYTSDGLLFVSGKTAEQNEFIVKRYMENSDIYIHSDSFGSGSGLIKNPLKLDIPESNPKSLIESGIFLISHTKSWETGVTDSAYWVRPEQVSKTPESGEYISKGSFIIRGQKNFIRVDKMELGFGIGFKVIGKEGFKGYVEKEEQIEYAIPILSTYSALTQYKFKVKIIPGTQKIKKALQEVLSTFTKKTNYYEKEAIKKISNDSIQKVLINKIRFVFTK